MRQLELSGFRALICLIALLSSSLAVASPRLVSAVSRKIHGPAGMIYDFPLSLNVLSPSVEPRNAANGNQTIILHFDQFLKGGTVDVLSANATVKSTQLAGNVLIINLAGVSNRQYVLLNYRNIGSLLSAETTSGVLKVGFLVGDVNGSRNVTSDDTILVLGKLSQPVSQQTYLYDIDLSGSLNASDFFAVNSQGSSSLPALPAPKGDRLIGMNIMNTTPSSSFTDNINFTRSTGASYTNLNLGWNMIEPTTPNDCSTPGNYVDPSNVLSIFNSVLPYYGLKLSLDIDPVATNMNQRPANLATRALDDPLLLCRYKKMLEFVFSKIPNVELVSMQFGNEIDVYPDSYGYPFWTQYYKFLAAAIPAAKTLRPGLLTSFTSTLDGVIGRSSNPLAKPGLQQLYSVADILVLTYYPLGQNFTMRSPDVVASDIGTVVSLYPTKTIYFNEIGYSSGSSYIGSSEEYQRQFIANAFNAWDKYRTQVKSMVFFRLNDISLAEAQNEASWYGIQLDTFVEYLQTLGLRSFFGADKPAYRQLRNEALSRGW